MVNVARNQKLGVLSLSFNDLTVPVAGLPIQIVRSYDSRLKTAGDFGVGWTLNIANVRLQKNRPLGKNWTETVVQGFFEQTCLQPASDRIVTVNEPPGASSFIIFRFDGREHLQNTSDLQGKSAGYSYNPAQNQETVTDRNGNATTYQYDGDGNVLQTTDALGNSTTATYDANDNKLSDTNALGKTTIYTYDRLGNKATETDPLGHVTAYTYNGRRQALTVTDPLGHATTNYSRCFNVSRPSRYASSKRVSSVALTPRQPATTLLAHSKYSRCLRASQLRGGLATIDHRLLVLSAILMSLARRDFKCEVSTCSRLRSSFGKRLSSVSSTTRAATSEPNSRSSSSRVVFVSSMVSCRRAPITAIASLPSVASATSRATSVK